MTEPAREGTGSLRGGPQQNLGERGTERVKHCCQETTFPLMPSRPSSVSPEAPRTPLLITANRPRPVIGAFLSLSPSRLPLLALGPRYMDHGTPNNIFFPDCNFALTKRVDPSNFEDHHGLMFWSLRELLRGLWGLGGSPSLSPVHGLPQPFNAVRGLDKS